MTRQHFKVIAQVIKEAGINELERKALAESMATELRQFNQAFDRGRFLEACGVTE